MSENVTRRSDEKKGDHHPHASRQPGVYPRGSFHSLNVQQSEDNREEDRPGPVGDARRKHVCLLADPDDADHRIQHVIHHHAPAGDIAERRIDFLANIGESRPGAGIRPRHAPIADRGKQHGDHRNQDGSDNVTVAALAQYAEDRHGGHRLDYDDAVKNQVPKRERSA